MLKETYFPLSQRTLSAPNLTPVTLGAGQHVWYLHGPSGLFHHRLCTHLAKCSQMAVQAPQDCARIVRNVATLGAGVAILVDYNVAKAQGTSCVCFWLLNYSEGWKGKANFLVPTQRPPPS